MICGAAVGISLFLAAPSAEAVVSSSAVLQVNTTDNTHPARDRAARAASGVRFSDPQICKAAIAHLMGRPPESIRARIHGEIVSLSYVRADDGTRWTYRCKVEGLRVIWASAPAGRWRTDPADETITYRTLGGPGLPRLEIEEAFSDGSSSTETFTSHQLR